MNKLNTEFGKFAYTNYGFIVIMTNEYLNELPNRLIGLAKCSVTDWLLIWSLQSTHEYTTPVGIDERACRTCPYLYEAMQQGLVKIVKSF